MRSIEDFLCVSMDSLGFLREDVEANETVITQKEDHPLNWDRLRDANDSYNSILFYPNREIVLKEGEYLLGVPPPKFMVSNEPSQDTVDYDEPLI
jgi:hypothetical protein